ncbi:MAG: Hsp70 family protein, partial [Phycisphaerae bacterium]|nr:Hsp70 family protein [Phycisphaerae bacterium]
MARERGSFAVGIDFGTTLSSIAYLDEGGRPTLLPNAEGELLTPSVVYFETDAVLVGREARRQMLVSPDRAVVNVKRHIGEPDWQFEVDGEVHTAESIVAIILRKLKHDAEMHIGPIEKAVITVPAYYDDLRRKATEDAAKIAGLAVLDIVNEPTAGALAYGFGKAEDGIFMVYDLGGGTFDVTVIEKHGQEFITLATDGDVQLGGKDWDERLGNYLAALFAREFGEDPRKDSRAMAYLLATAEEAKKALSASPTTRVSVSYKGNWGNYDVTREQFESLADDLVTMTELTAEMVLEEAGMTWQGVEKVVPTGGSIRMPMVQRMLERISRMTIDIEVPVDEAVAMGAAVHAAWCDLNSGDRITDYSAEVAERLGKIKASDVTAHAMGLIIKDAATLQYRNDVLIPRNTRLPASVT